MADLNKQQASTQTACEAQQFKHCFNYLLSQEKVTRITLWIQALTEDPTLFRVMFAYSEQNALYRMIACVNINEHKGEQASIQAYAGMLVQCIQSQLVRMCEYS